MRKPHALSLISAAGLLTAVASVGQPQSMDPATTPTDSSTTTSSTSTSSSSSSSYGTADRDQSTTTTPSSGTSTSSGGPSGTPGDSGMPASPTAEADQPRSSSGSVSDDAYLPQEIRHHKDAISPYRAQASGGSDPDLRQFARDQLPALEHHLEMLQGSHAQK